MPRHQKDKQLTIKNAMAETKQPDQQSSPTPPEEVEIIMPPNPVANKVTRGGFGAVDAKTLARAEQVIQDLGQDYLNWVEKDLGRLIAAFEALQTSSDPKAALQDLFQVAHDIKGQGGSFGYELMTRLGNHLCRLVDSIDTVGPQEQAAIQLHIDAMRNVIHERRKGTGDEADLAVVQGLDQLVQKLTSK